MTQENLFKTNDGGDPEEIKGIFVHDCTDWKTGFLEDADGGPTCLWWNRLPTAKWGILEKLRKIVDDGGTFEIYYLQNMRACYRAVVRDFSLECEYGSKYREWKAKYDPAGIFEDYKLYWESEKHYGAAIVFMAEKFEQIPDKDQIPWENFVRYKDMNYDRRGGGIAAFTAIRP